MEFNYEESVIDPILGLIKKHQVYLTQEENLPQLAKLGYMYNTLWYSGRTCWGYNGIIKSGGSCENNPKYKIEECDAETSEIEDFIYSAWAMHSIDIISWDDFHKTIFDGIELTSFEIKCLKQNKTFDEWVDILMSKDYKYNSIFTSRHHVLSTLLFTNGTEYKYSNGFIVKDSCGTDVSLYKDWQNAKFDGEIKEVVDLIMNMDEVKETIQKCFLYRTKIKEEDESTKYTDSLEFESLKNELLKEYPDLDFDNIFNQDQGQSRVIKEKYYPYYPFCDYSNIFFFDENTDPSYIKAGIEACEEILEHIDVEPFQNIEFAKEFLKRFK